MKKISNKTTKAIACAVIAIAIGATASLQAGVAPWISPNYDYVIGEGKILDVYCGGGSSDEPDYEAPCPPWSLSSGTEVWNWTLSGPGSKSGDENQITVTSTGVGPITVSVNRNDTYSDEKQPDPTTDSGVVSAESDEITIYSVIAKAADNQKVYFFNHPSHPYPSDVEEKNFVAEGLENVGTPVGRIDWSASPQCLEFTDNVGGSGGTYVVANSTAASENCTVTASWGSETLGTVNVQIIEFSEISQGPYTWSPIDEWNLFGWDSTLDWIVLGSDGRAIDGVGVNEEFGPFTNDNPNNWPRPSEFSGVIESGVFGDHYSIVSPNFGPFVLAPAPDPTGSSGLKLISANQSYYIGSKNTGDGVKMRSHTLAFCRGYPQIE